MFSSLRAIYDVAWEYSRLSSLLATTDFSCREHWRFECNKTKLDGFCHLKRVSFQ